MRSDLTPWQFSIFSKSCGDAERGWTYAAVSVQDHHTVGHREMPFYTVSVHELMLQKNLRDLVDILGFCM